MNIITRIDKTAWALVLLIPIAASVSRFAADLFLSLTAVLFLVQAAMSRQTDWLQCRWVQVALLLWVYLLVNGLFAQDASSSVGRAAAWLRFPIFAVALSFWLLRTMQRHTQLMMSLSFAVGFMIIDTFIQYLFGIELLMREPIPAEGSPRLTGPFSAPRVGIMIIWMAVPAMVWWLSQSGRKSMALGLLFTAGSAVVIFLSGERMAFLLTGLAFVLAFLLVPGVRLRMVGIGIITVAMLAVAVWQNPGLIDRQGQQTSEVVAEISGSVYGQIWQSGWEMVKQHPLNGVGLRQFREHCPDAAYGSDAPQVVELRCNLHPHNMYLEWLVEAGVIGLAGFFMMVLLWLKPALSNYQHMRHNALFIGLLITLCIRLWPLASTTSFFTAWSAVPFWLMVGWWLSVVSRDNAVEKYELRTT